MRKSYIILKQFKENLLKVSNIIKEHPLSFILFGYFSIAFYRLDKIPGEWYGDISNVHEYVFLILNGEFPFFFFQSAGPIYHYLISPLIFLIGSRYIQYKIASVMVGGLAIFTIYKMADVLVGKMFAFLVAAVASFSFWTIVWARTGNSQILVPVLTATIVYSIEKYFKVGKYRYLILGIASSSAGLFTYPATFILPLFLFLIFLSTYNSI